MKPREMTEDQREMALVIKHGEDRMAAFQEYWKKRCGNPDYLTDHEIYKILMDYALDVFHKEEFINIKESLRWQFVNKDSVTIKNINGILLAAIWGMKMVEED